MPAADDIGCPIFTTQHSQSCTPETSMIFDYLIFVSFTCNVQLYQMKEAAATAEVNQMLAKEQAGLQKETQRLQQNVEEERSYKEKHKANVADAIKKVICRGYFFLCCRK